MTDSIFAWALPASVGDNDDADATINWLENQNPDTVNNSARAMMARHAEFISDLLGLKATAGTGAAYTVTATQSPASLPDGFTVYLLPHATNTGTCTLNVNSLGAKPLRLTSATNATAGDIKINKPIRATYYLSGDEFLIDAANVSGALTSLIADTSPQLGGQLDVNGQALGDGTNELLTFTEDASAVNHVNIENEAAGSGPIISAAGDDTNIDLNLAGKGSGAVKIGSSEVVTLAGTQTLTNKTLTSPDIDVGSDAEGDIYYRDGSGNLARLAIGTAGQSLAVNSGATAPEWTDEAAGGAWELIGTVTASNDASVAFTGLSSTYFAYKVYMDDITPATDSVTFYMRTSTNNGSSYDSGASDYEWTFMRSPSNSSTPGGSGDTADSQIEFGLVGGSSGNEALSGFVDIINPSGTGETRVVAIINYDRASAVLEQTTIAGKRKSAADVDAIQFLYSSGNIESGTFKLYGIKAS